MDPHHEPQGISAPAPANSLPAGTRMHEYEITAVLGEGGFGIVYLATDTLLGREVAIKEYLPISHAKRSTQLQVEARTPDQQSLFEKGLKSFVAEARILAQFRHPNLVEVMRFWEGNGTAYIVMPYYQGKTLRDLQQKGFRVTDQVSLFNLLLPLLNGLKQVHAVGCFHRDISLDNIIVLPDGSPLLLDFGAARHEILNQADSATVILKPGFAPIEQYGGKETATQQGPWTDIYALSAVAYQLISGVAPPSSVARIMRDPLVPLAGQAAQFSLPLPVLKAIDAGLQVQPEDRPQSVLAFRALLLAKEPVLESVTDVARVHEQPLVVPLPVAAQPGPASQTGLAVPDAASAAVPARHGMRPPVWLTALALLLVLGIAAALLWRSPSDGGAPAAETEALAAQADAPASTGVPHVVVPRAEGLATGAAAATAAGVAGTEARPSEQLVPGGDGAGVSQAASLQANEILLPDAAVPVLQEHQALQVPPGATAQTQVPPEVPELVPPPTVGYVLVQAQPWGDVYLNGVLKGTTPPSLRLEVPLGNHSIEVRNDSAPSHTQTVTVEGGQTVRVSHHFSP